MNLNENLRQSKLRILKQRSKIILNQTSKHPDQKKKKTRCTEPPTQLNLYTIENRLYISQSSYTSPPPLSLSRSSSPINRGLKFHYSAKRPPAIFPAQPLPDKQRENGSPTIGPRQETAGIRNHEPNQTERSRTRPRNTDSNHHNAIR